MTGITVTKEERENKQLLRVWQGYKEKREKKRLLRSYHDAGEGAAGGEITRPGS
jgi:hypothetical protein